LKITKKGLFKITLFTSLLIALIVAWLGFGDRGFIHLFRMENERQHHLDRIHSLEQENQRLLNEIQRLRRDKEYIESVARRELNLTKDDEIHFRVFKKKGEKARVTEQTPKSP
jgi:cell division protein FtsB